MMGYGRDGYNKKINKSIVYFFALFNGFHYDDYINYLYSDITI